MEVADGGVGFASEGRRRRGGRLRAEDSLSKPDRVADGTGGVPGVRLGQISDFDVFESMYSKHSIVDTRRSTFSRFRRAFLRECQKSSGEIARFIWPVSSSMGVGHARRRRHRQGIPGGNGSARRQWLSRECTVLESLEFASNLLSLSLFWLYWCGAASIAVIVVRTESSLVSSQFRWTWTRFEWRGGRTSLPLSDG